MVLDCFSLPEYRNLRIMERIKKHYKFYQPFKCNKCFRNEFCNYSDISVKINLNHLTLFIVLTKARMTLNENVIFEGWREMQLKRCVRAQVTAVKLICRTTKTLLKFLQHLFHQKFTAIFQILQKLFALTWKPLV